MQCPKCGSQLRPSKKKENCYLCDNCRIRMTQEYLNKSISNTRSKSKTHRPMKWVFGLLLLLLLTGGIFGFIYLDLWNQINSKINPPVQVSTLTDELSLKITSYEMIDDRITLRPLSGHKYLVLSLEFSNNSTDNITLNEMYNFELYADDIRIPYFSAAPKVLAELGFETINNTCAPGQTLQGNLCYELSSSWENVMLHYTPQIWSSTDITVTLKNTNY